MKNNFEQQLGSLQLKQPSSNYLKKANKILNPTLPTWSFNMPYLIPLCLLLSLAFNFFQYHHIKEPATEIIVADSLLKNQHGELKINIVPKTIKPDLSTVELSMDNFALNHFCLKNSAVIIDDNFYMGKISGFGEFVELRFPEFYQINISLKPLRSWQQIGSYLDGVIKLDIDENHILEMLNVGIGPSGMKKGGPFKIFGSIKPTNNVNRKKYIQIEQEHVLNKLPARLQTIIMRANRQNPYFPAGVTIGNDESSVNREHLYRTIGAFFTGFDCG